TDVTPELLERDDRLLFDVGDDEVAQLGDELRQRRRASARAGFRRPHRRRRLGARITIHRCSSSVAGLSPARGHDAKRRRGRVAGLGTRWSADGAFGYVAMRFAARARSVRAWRSLKSPLSRNAKDTLRPRSTMPISPLTPSSEPVFPRIFPANRVSLSS